jgi:hypothetical protein
MARDTGLFHTFACALADRLTRNALNREAEYLTMVSLIYAQAASVFGGERIYGPRTNQVEREQARLRIAQAIQAGEPSSLIAKREGVDPSLVRRIRRRGTIRP